jgi:membrane associated rhomboid family serine protease
LERKPGAVAAGQWWRFVTPWFVHAEDRRQMLFNFMAVVGTFVERILAAAIGSYCILSAECLASLRAAGTSVARCALLGALAVRVLARKPGRTFCRRIHRLGGRRSDFLSRHSWSTFTGAVLASVLLMNGHEESELQ